MKEVAALIGRAVRDADGSAAREVADAVGALVDAPPGVPAPALSGPRLVREYLLTLVVAAAVTYLLTPVARRLALRWGAMTPVARPRRARHPDPAARRHGDAGRVRRRRCSSRTQLPFLGPRFGNGQRRAGAARPAPC